MIVPVLLKDVLTVNNWRVEATVTVNIQSTYNELNATHVLIDS